jgi:hypothetical protein
VIIETTLIIHDLNIVGQEVITGLIW